MENIINKKGFQKGKSGNPSGRPKTPQEVRDAFRLYTTDARNVLVEIMADAEAKSSDRIRAAETILNRAWGSPEHAIAISGSMTSVEIDTSRLEKKDQDALLTALVGIYSENKIEENEAEITD